MNIFTGMGIVNGAACVAALRPDRRKFKSFSKGIGEIKPTFKQIETLSNQTNIPFGYFFLQEPPVEDTKILEYRTINSIELENPSRELIDTIDNMESIQEWMRNYQIKQGYNTLDIVGSAKDNMDG